MKKTWFSIKAAASLSDDGPAAEVSIYDEIGYWGVTAKDFIDAIKPYKGKALDVAINSPGGDVWAGIAIYNALRAHGGTVTTRAMGVAASAASIVMMAGDKREMPANAMIMVHNPWSFAAGNADELRETADVLDKIGDSLASIYVARTGKPDEEIRAMLATDTWLSADESLALGFVDNVTPSFEAKALFDLDRLPDAARAVFDAARKPEPTPTPPALPESLADVLATLAKSAGVEDHLQVLVTDDSVTDEASARNLIARARDVKAYALHAGLPDLAAALIRERKSVPDARAALQAARAAEDEATVVNTAPPKQSSTPAVPGVSSTSIWNDIKAMKAGSKQ